MVDAKGNKDARDKGTETQDASHEIHEELVRSEARELEIVDVREGAFGTHTTGDTSGFGGLTQPVIMPGASQQPYGGWYDEVADKLATLGTPTTRSRRSSSTAARSRSSSAGTLCSRP